MASYDVASNSCQTLDVGKVYFWDLVDAKIEETIDAHPGATVCGLDYHPKKEVMVTSSTDGTAKFWVPTGGRADY